MDPAPGVPGCPPLLIGAVGLSDEMPTGAPISSGNNLVTGTIKTVTRFECQEGFLWNLRSRCCVSRSGGLAGGGFPVEEKTD